MQNATPITYNIKKEYSNEFEIFWKEYPNRPNDNKFGASQKFQLVMKNKEISFQDLMKKTEVPVQVHLLQCTRQTVTL